MIPNSAIGILADLMPGLWHALERPEARVSLRRSVLKAAEQPEVWRADPNGMPARILDEAILARRGAGKLLPASGENGRLLWGTCHGLREATGTNTVE